MGHFHKCGRRMLCLILGCLTLWMLAALPVSAVMAEIELNESDRLAATVYYGPGERYLAVGKLENGTALAVLDETDSYYEIEIEGMTAYLEKSQVKADENGCLYVSCRADAASTDVIPGVGVKQLRKLRAKVLALAEEQLGVPYVYGGMSPSGFDCSGFVKYIYDEMGYTINRTADTQLVSGVAVNREDLQPGDLVFFCATTNDGAITSHVGIYAGDNQFIHAASDGIRYSSLDDDYYADKYLCARRILLPGQVQYRSLPEQNIAAKSSGQKTGAFLCIPA